MRIKLYYHTLRYLKLSQIYGRLWHKIARHRKFRLCPTPPTRQVSKNFVAPPLKSIRMLAPNQFQFLNETRSLIEEKDWNDINTPKLWLYNLHYFDDLTAEDHTARREWHQQLINRWIMQNPLGHGNGWEAYPLSLRIINWIKWSLLNNQISDNVLKSLAIQTHYLSKHLETHLLGNHLLTNAKALIFAGLYFQNTLAQSWLNKGLQIFYRELSEQILADGGHFERSPMYHAIILEDILDIINIAQTYEFTLNKQVYTTVQKMFDWLATMCHPDGDIALFNDAAFNIATKLNDLCAYAKALNITQSIQPSYNLLLAESGYAHLTIGKANLLVDVAPVGPDYLPGHGHADTFTFEFTLDKQRILVDTGTSLYAESNERSYQRSTAAHNTLTIDNENSSQVWSSFRVAQRAKVYNTQLIKQDDLMTLSAQHDGYTRLKDPVTHLRTWQLNKNQLIIHDELRAKKKHLVKLYFHFHPDITLTKVNAHSYAVNKDGQFLAHIKLDEQLTINLTTTPYHPEFGKTITRNTLIATVEQILPQKLMTELTWTTL